MIAEAQVDMELKTVAVATVVRVDKELKPALPADKAGMVDTVDSVSAPAG